MQRSCVCFVASQTSCNKSTRLQAETNNSHPGSSSIFKVCDASMHWHAIYWWTKTIETIRYSNSTFDLSHYRLCTRTLKEPTWLQCEALKWWMRYDLYRHAYNFMWLKIEEKEKIDGRRKIVFKLCAKDVRLMGARAYVHNSEMRLPFIHSFHLLNAFVSMLRMESV